MSKFHGLDCECCKDKIPAVQDILLEISKIVGPGASTGTDSMLQQLKNLSSSEFGGKLEDIVQIAEEFFAAPIEDLNVEQLKLTQPDKKVGKFKVSDLCDVPTLDVTKVIDLSKFNLSKLNSLKFSLSIPTIEVVKTLSIPPVSIDFKFLLNRKGLAFFPVLDAGIKTKEDAIKKIKGFKVLQPIKSSLSLDSAKALALKSYPTSLEVNQAVADSQTTIELMDKLGKLGVMLYDEVDPGEEVESFLELEKQGKEIQSSESTCGTIGVTLAPFNPDELKSLSDDCCNENVDTDGDGFLDTEDDEIESPPGYPVDDKGVAIKIDDQLNQLESNATIDENAELDKTNKFLDSLKSSNAIIQQCAKEKVNSLNSYYWYVEASILNDIALEYVTSRSLMLDALTGKFLTLESERNALIKEVNEIKAFENKEIKGAFNRLFPAGNPVGSTATFVLSLGAGTTGAVQLTASQLQSIENDESFKQSVNNLRKTFSEKQNRIAEISSLIQDQKANFELPTLTQGAVQDLLTYGATGPSASSEFTKKIKSFRSVFDISENTITNQVGYNISVDPFNPLDVPNGDLSMRVHPIILSEAKTLFALGSPEIGEISDYVKPLTFRRGKLADEVWEKFYSADRIDFLFTYQEQGYLTPKPQFDNKGKPLSSTKTVKVKSPTGQEINQPMSENALNLKIDDKVSAEFWANVDEKVLQKMQNILTVIRESPQFSEYLALIKSAGENEAKYSFAANLVFQESSYNTRTFNSYTNTFNSNTSGVNSALVVNIDTPLLSEAFKNQFQITYDSLISFKASMKKKMDDLLSFIEVKKKCIADQEAKIIDTAKKFGGSSPNSSPPNEECPPKLGSDPLGRKPASACPGITKNCYWEEYTKLIQQVSIMPIPDDAATGQLTKRLFRYYPVGIQIPVPTPTPAVLPTLASGIPDPMISIPMPLIWKHIISASTPIGLFVVWIAICGPVPGPYVMFIDEKMDPCFLVTPKGPISIPAKSLKISGTDDKSLLEILAPLKDTFKLPAIPKIVGGNGKVKTGDPDDKASLIDKIQEKIKAASDSIKPEDPWTVGATSQSSIIEFKNRVNKALRNYPPDIQAVQEALDKIGSVIDKQVDKISISPIKFPKNPKKLVTPIVGPAELAETFNKLIDGGIELPSIGLGVPVISLRDKIKKLVDVDLSSPEVKQKFADIDREVSEMEAELAISGASDAEKIKARAEKLRDAIKAPVQKVADNITPEMLGFIAGVSVPVPLPVPCYDNIEIDPVPPYILALLAAAKALPDALDSLPIEQFANSLSKLINLSVPLPRVENTMFAVTQVFIATVPDLKFPDPASINLLKQNLKAAAQNFFKIKIRLPKPGAVQITIPSSMIKEAMKAAIKGAFTVVVSMIIAELTDAANNGNFVKVLAVAAIIKGIFGTDLGSISGEDIKAFITSSLDSVNDQLSSIESMIPSLPSIDFKSIKETLFPTLPPKIFNEGPFIEISTEALLQTTEPLLQALGDAPLPYAVTLLGASQAPGRAVLTKLHPFEAKELLPSWEKMTLKNLPFTIWLDQFVATAQKQGGLFSDYVIPYYLPDA